MKKTNQGFKPRKLNLGKKTIARLTSKEYVLFGGTGTNNPPGDSLVPNICKPSTKVDPVTRCLTKVVGEITTCLPKY
jgi:hypothetical protein